jgi:hypothetical protein
MNKFHVIGVVLTLVLLDSLCVGDEPGLRVRMTIDLKDDLGQGLGTLWEAVDSQGRPMAGAGFLNAYNTQDRSDRQMLHVYVRTSGEANFAPERLPRSTTDAGTYLFGFDGKLFAKGRSPYMDNKVRVWESGGQRWNVDPQTVAFSMHVAGKVLVLNGRAITYGDQPVLELKPTEGRLGEWYYAAGRLVVRRFDSAAEPPVNELIAIDWKPGEPSTAIDRGVAIPLSHPTEFIYAFGSLGGEIVTASNRGSVHSFVGRTWKSVRAPDGMSFQVYSTLNTENGLLLGQYPTGEMFEYASGQLKRLEGWPPVMPGVRSAARELQTLAIYGGDIYAGVWPWGELWRRDLSTNEWQFVGRMFTHPEPTDKTTHPYENETKALNPVANIWGQRVTSLVPLGDSLYISTSAKTSKPFEPKYEFLAGSKHLEYGTVYRYRKPGCLAVPITWNERPLELEFHIASNSIDVRQDGRLLKTTKWSKQHPARLEGATPRKGVGVYGLFSGHIIDFE